MRVLVVFILFQSVSAHGDGSLHMDTYTPMPHSAYLDPNEKYHVAWNFDDENIIFEVQVETLGYIGLGISPNGGMKDSDIVIAGVSNGKAYGEDRYATSRTEPIMDDDQDWAVISGSENNTHTIVRFWRKLDTCDTQDRAIKQETVRLIWAYHSQDWYEAGSRYHGANRGSKSVFLLNTQKEVPILPADSFTVDFVNDKVQIPEGHTTYWCKTFAVPKLVTKHHVIKFEPLVEPGNEGIVHHMILAACSSASRYKAGDEGECYGEMPELPGLCAITIFAWAVGAGPFYMPEHVGYPFGFEEDPPLLFLQIHYDNPAMKSGLVDSSGMRLTMSSELRKFDAGTLSTGVLVWPSMIIPPGMDTFRTDGHCTSECFDQGFGNETRINIFAAFLHSHLLGTGIRFRHIRNGKELKPISVDDSYDFNFQETRVVEPEVRVEKGDHLITECTYTSKDRDVITFGGESTRHEMCLTFAMFYPRVPLMNCYSGVNPSAIAAMVGVKVMHAWNLTITEPEQFRGTNLISYLRTEVKWTDEMKKSVQSLAAHENNPYLVTCFETMSNLFPITGQPRYAPKFEPYMEADTCAVVTSGAPHQRAFQWLLCSFIIFLKLFI